MQRTEAAPPKHQASVLTPRSVCCDIPPTAQIRSVSPPRAITPATHGRSPQVCLPTQDLARRSVLTLSCHLTSLLPDNLQVLRYNSPEQILAWGHPAIAVHW